MARADFYLIAGKQRFVEKPLLLVCELARKACDADQPLLILATSQAQADVLDELLWEFDADSYVPHQIAGTDEDDDITPVLILPPEMQAPMRPLVINLRAEAVTGAFTRVLEVVPADDGARGPSRERWKAYKERGLDVQKFDM